MQKSFIDKVLKSGCYDTALKRFVVEDEHDNYDQYQIIKSIKREDLCTTASLNYRSPENPNGWTTVWTGKHGMGGREIMDTMKREGIDNVLVYDNKGKYCGELLTEDCKMLPHRYVIQLYHRNEHACQIRRCR
jgi:hypothetical protein